MLIREREEGGVVLIRSPAPSVHRSHYTPNAIQTREDDLWRNIDHRW